MAWETWEDFEDGDITNNPTWNTEKAATWAATTNAVYSGTYGGELDGYGKYSSNSTSSISSLADYIHYKVKFKMDNTATGSNHGYIYIKDSGNNLIASIYARGDTADANVDNSSEVAFYDSDANMKLIAGHLSRSNWYTLIMENVGSGEVTFTVKSADETTTHGTITSSYYPTGTPYEIWVVNYLQNNIYYDDFKVAKTLSTTYTKTLNVDSRISKRFAKTLNIDSNILEQFTETQTISANIMKQKRTSEFYWKIWDDFEDGDVTNNPTWNAQGKQDDIFSASSTAAYQGSYGGDLDGWSAFASSSTSSINNLADYTSYKVKFKMDNTAISNNHAYIYVNDSADNRLAELSAFGDTADVNVDDSTEVAFYGDDANMDLIAGHLSRSNWYTLIIEDVGSGEVTFTVKSADEVTTYGTMTSSSFSSGTPAEICIVSFAQNNYYYDNFQVGKKIMTINSVIYLPQYQKNISFESYLIGTPINSLNINSKVLQSYQKTINSDSLINLAYQKSINVDSHLIGLGPGQSATTLPSTGASEGSDDILWQGPSAITADDGGVSYATNNQENLKYTNFLRGTSYGFNIPSNAVITGFEVEFEAQRDSYGAGSSSYLAGLRLVQGGSNIGNTKDDTGNTWPTSFQIYTYGNNSDMWGTSLTPSDVNDSTFGAELKAAVDYSQAQVDYIKITVYYKKLIINKELKSQSRIRLLNANSLNLTPYVLKKRSKDLNIMNEIHLPQYTKTLNTNSNIFKQYKETLNTRLSILEKIQSTLNLISYTKKIKDNSLIVNSNIFERSTKVLNINAFLLKKIQENLSTISYLLKKEKQNLAVNSTVFKQLTEALNLKSNIFKQYEEVLGINNVVLYEEERDLDLISQVLKQKTQDLNVNNYLLKQKTQDLPINSNVFKQYLKQFSVDSVITLITNQKTQNILTYLLKKEKRNLGINALLRTPQEQETLNIKSYLLKQKLKNIEILSEIYLSQYTKTLNINGAILKKETKSLRLKPVILKKRSIIQGLINYILKQEKKQLNVNSKVYVPEYEQSLPINNVIYLTQYIKSLTTKSNIQVTKQKTLNSNNYILKIKTETINLVSSLLEKITESVSITTNILKKKEIEISGKSYILKQRTRTRNVINYVKKIKTGTLSIKSSLLESLSKALTLASYITGIQHLGINSYIHRARVRFIQAEKTRYNINARENDKNISVDETPINLQAIEE